MATEKKSTDQQGNAEILARELSDVAKLSAEVIEKGLVRETRPVFVFDKKLAESKKGNAARQEKFRSEREKEGLKMGLVPVAALEKVKELGGGAAGWDKFLAMSVTKEAVLSDGTAPIVEPAVRLVEVIKEVVREVPVEKIIEKQVIKEVPGPIEYRYEIKEIEIEKPVTDEQKKTLYIGAKVRALTGFRRKLVKFLIGI